MAQLAMPHRFAFGNVKRVKRFLLVTAVAALSTLVLATPAQADDQSYIDYLRSHGWGPQYPVEALPGMMEKSGHYICGQLHAGWRPEDIAASMRPNNAIAVEAAQHELCPDTLA